MLYYEDIEVGRTRRFGEYAVTREEVVDFAAKYDPQPFHLDEEAAAQTHFGRIAASGWHSCAMAMAMIAREWERQGHVGLGSPGIDELRWHKPVHPGDTLSCEAEVEEKRESRSRPEMGLYRERLRLLNQHGDVVLSFVAINLIARRGA